MKVAVIGSFRRHYAEVTAAIDTFRQAGLEVTSPAGSAVLDPTVEFVRFETDDETLSDPEVQTATLRRIFEADAVYVVAPDGYVGRTTCYEIGRLVQADRPVYLSHHPADLPIRVAAHLVMDPARFAKIAGAGTPFESMHASSQDAMSRIERALVQ